VTYDVPRLCDGVDACRRAVGQPRARVRDRPSNGQAVRVVDAVADGKDWVPGVLDSVHRIASVLRCPRSVIRSAMRGD
jgi:hypothetical protein